MNKPYEVDILYNRMVPNTVTAKIFERRLIPVVEDFARTRVAKDHYPVIQGSDHIEFWLEFSTHDASELVDELRAMLYEAWLELLER